ncbi:MAG: hypothetical protein K6C96_12075 [Butyrivibrio sp.]|nr:hypothetical protein [Butyrivibrio sp.]
MRVKKYLGIALSIGLAICTAGCGEKFPELTDQEYAQTVEYAAGLLMKHSNNGQERLVYIDAEAVERQRAKEAEVAAKAEEEKKEQAKPVQPTPTPVQPQIPEGSETLGEDGQSLTTGDEATGEGSSESEAGAEETGTAEVTATEEDPDAIVLSDEDTQEIIDDIFLSYQGYMVASTYPESSKSYFVNADKNKKLLVLRFDLYNGSDSSKSVNIIPLHPQFQIIFNGENIGYSSVTVLPNDLSTYSGTIDSRAHESVVVLTQISADDAKNIQSLGMIVTLRGETQNVVLK